MAFQPVEFNPYGRRRARRLVPRWLLLLVFGVLLGAAAVVYVQERHLPPRLTAPESEQLQRSLEQARAEQAKLRRELDETRRQRDAALGEKQALTSETAASRDSITKLREDVAALLAALPPDPRPGAVEIRAARFAVEEGSLGFDVMLTRDREAAGKPPTSGVLQLVVAAEGARGTAGRSITLPTVPVSVGAYENVRGKLPLPAGFKPFQATVNVLEKEDGKRLGMRVLLVR
jgi:hypothetical protein